jgi:hypothetical protein
MTDSADLPRPTARHMYSLSMQDRTCSEDWVQIMSNVTRRQVEAELERRGVNMTVRLQAVEQAADLANSSPVRTGLIVNVDGPWSCSYRILARSLERLPQVQEFYDGYPDWVEPYMPLDW